MDCELQSTEACESQQGTSIQGRKVIHQFFFHPDVMGLLHDALLLYTMMPFYVRTSIQIWWISGLSRFTTPIKVNQLGFPLVPHNDVRLPKIPKDKVFLVQFLDRLFDIIEKISGCTPSVKSIPR